MTTYSISAPDGKTYQIDGPPNASQAAVQAEVMRQFPQAAGSSQPASKAAPAAPQVDNRPTSFFAGLAEGVHHGLARIGQAEQYVADKTGLIKPINALAGMFGYKMDAAQAAQEHQAKLNAAPVQQSGFGRFVGDVAGAAPALLVPGGVFAQGAAGGLMTGDATDPSGLVSEAAGGAAGGKIGDIIGGAVVNKFGQMAAKRAAQNASRVELGNIANRLNIRPSAATVGTPTTEVLQRAALSTPGAQQAVAPIIEQETTDLGNAATNAAAKLGNAGTPQTAGAAIVEGKNAFEQAGRSEASNLYNARTAAMGGDNAPVLPTETKAVYDRITQDFPNLPPALQGIFNSPLVRKMANTPDEFTLNEATNLLSNVRAEKNRLLSNNDVSAEAKSRITDLEQALENDVMSSAKAADTFNASLNPAAPSAAANQTAADAAYAAMKQQLGGSLKRASASARGDINVSPESVYNQFANDLNQRGGNIQRAKSLWQNLPQANRGDVAASHLDIMGRANPGAQNAAGDNWSFNTFLTNYNKMSQDGKKLIFGGTAADQDIQDIAKYASRLREIDKTRNTSGTAMSATNAGIGISAITHLLGGDLQTAISTGIAAPMALNGAAKILLRSPAGRNWTKLAAKAAVNNQPSVIRNLIAQLPRVAGSTPGGRPEIMALQQSLKNVLSGQSVLASNENK